MRNRAILILAILLATTLVAYATPAQAQGAQINPTITVIPTSDKVKPLQGSITMSGTATYTADASSNANIVGIPVEYKATKFPPWASVTISPANDVIALAPGAAGAGSAQVTGSRTFTVSVLASDQAPAFQPADIEITATFRPQQPGATPVSKATTVPIQADYFSILDVVLTQSIQQDRPQATVAFPVKITNLGNGNTKVNFAIAEGGNPKDLGVIVPGPTILQSKQAGGNLITAEIPLSIQLPHRNGYMNEPATVTYQITSNYALDPKLRGDETQFTVLVTTKGFYVPGPGPFLLLGVLLVGAIILRRRS